MKGENRSLLTLVSLFLLTQALGLYVGSIYMDLLRRGYVEPLFEQPEKIENSLLIVFYILASTGLILIFIKFWKKLIKALEIVAIFFSAGITFDLLFPFQLMGVPVSLVLSSLLVSWRIFKPSILNRNFSLILSAAGIGSILGCSLGIFPLIILMLVLSIYDFVSVFVTKHMVYMAKEVSKTSTAFSLAVPQDLKPCSGKKARKVKKVHVFQLGGGDIIIPLTFFVCVLNNYSLAHSLISLAFSTLFLFLSIYKVIERPGRAIPALPWVSAGCLVGFLISILLIP